MDTPNVRSFYRFLRSPLDSVSQWSLWGVVRRLKNARFIWPRLMAQPLYQLGFPSKPQGLLVAMGRKWLDHNDEPDSLDES